MKIRKPDVVTCSCGNMAVTRSPERVLVRGGWIQIHQRAICTECQESIRIGPQIVLVDKDGEPFHTMQS